jgi:hypothetical protein
MIDPTHDDIGKSVIYTGNRYPGGKPELGVITSFNDHAVFVRYGSDVHSQGTNRTDLEWMPTDPSHPWYSKDQEQKFKWNMSS